MKTGKISESVLKRSVLRQIKTHREEIIKGAGIGEDCAFLSYLTVSTQTVTLPVQRAGYLALMAAANNLAASGAEPFAANVAITLPEHAEESALKEIMKQLEHCARQWNMEISGGHTEVSPAVNSPVITVTAMGKPITESIKKIEKDALDVVVSKWIGMEGTAIIADEKEAELTTRYPEALVLQAQQLGAHLSVAPEAALALKSGVCRMHDMRNGGIFGALWEISRLLGVGLSIDLKKIPVKQETIEICEFFDLNPYTLLSGGSLLMVTEDGDALVEKLEENGIPAAVIGQTNSGNDKIVTNREEVRYLEPTVPDEIYKLTFN